MLDTEQNIHKTIKEFDKYIESLNIDESKYIDEDFSYLDEEEEIPI